MTAQTLPARPTLLYRVLRLLILPSLIYYAAIADSVISAPPRPVDDLASNCSPKQSEGHQKQVVRQE